MSRNCTKCGKQVYHAEEQLYEGKLFHISCFGVWNKERLAADLAARNRSYEAPADVQPAYYRTNDTGSTGPRMETGSQYKQDSSPRSTGASGAAGGSKCTKCGSQLKAGAKFCGECGNKL